MALGLEIVGLSDRGLVREGNEDSILVADLDAGEVLSGEEAVAISGSRGALLVLCDGMGGSVGGEVASSMACQSIFRALSECPPADDRAVLARNLRRAVRLANLDIGGASSEDSTLHGMGTTVSAAALVGRTLVIAQVGDSRVYVQRGEVLRQVTRDQSVVSALVNSGQLSEERAPYSMQRGRILQAVGTMPDVDVSLSIAELCRGDRILLCSDGLHDSVEHGVLESSGAKADELEGLAAEYLELAHAGGGADNISLILANVLDGPDADDESDLPYAELDPDLEGEAAVTTTSMVGRRLAHQAGLRKEPGPRRLPQTAQHPAISEDEYPGPAERALAAGSSVSPWVLAGVGCIVLGALGWWFS